MTLIRSDRKSILLRSINIWLASYWQLTPRFTITVDKSHTVAQLVRALLANSKVDGSSPGGVTDDFFFLSYLACKC